MRIQVITERIVRESNYWIWGDATIKAMNTAAGKRLVSKEDFAKLLNDKELVVRSKHGNSTVTTTFKILEE